MFTLFKNIYFNRNIKSLYKLKYGYLIPQCNVKIPTQRYHIFCYLNNISDP